MVHRAARRSTLRQDGRKRDRGAGGYEPDEPEPDEPEDDEPVDPVDALPLSADADEAVSVELVPAVEPPALPLSPDDFLA
jgi:hypothetical protein